MPPDTSNGHIGFGKDIGGLARDLYRGGPLAKRLIQHHRHRICPLDLVVSQVPRGSSVLDIGCGGGLLVALLAVSGRARTALGIDASAPAIRTAHEMAARLETHTDADVSFEHRRVEESLPDERFDAVCLIDVLHHVPVPAQEQAFREAAARVGEGGVLVYKDMGDTPRWRAGMSRLHDLVLAREWVTFPPIERVEAWASDEGLDARVAEDVNMLWYGHELRVFHRSGGEAA